MKKTNIKLKLVWVLFLILATSTQPMANYIIQQTKQKVTNHNENEKYLTAAIKSAEWIISTRKENTLWPDDTGKPGDITPGISEGASGKIIFFIELYHVTNDPKYLEEAKLGGNYLINFISNQNNELDSLQNHFTFYWGVPGIGYTLNELYKTTGEIKYLSASKKCFEWISANAEIKNNSATWSSYNDLLMGNTGTGLFLTYLYEQMGSKDALLLAEKVANNLLERKIVEKEGYTWKVDQTRDFILPNFSHGAAGIGYLFATLYEKTGKQKYLDVAIKSVNYLKSIAKENDNIFLVPYGYPDIGWRTPYNIAWAHGSAGTARLFYKLWEITKHENWKNLIQKCVNGIKESGLPGLPSDTTIYGSEPFDTDLRFGQAGVADFFMKLYLQFKNDSYLDHAKLLMDDIVKKGSSDKNGIYWPAERYVFMTNKGDPAKFTGYFYGAAGYGLELLQLHKITKEKEGLTIKFPDDPF